MRYPIIRLLMMAIFLLGSNRCFPAMYRRFQRVLPQVLTPTQEVMLLPGSATPFIVRGTTTHHLRQQISRNLELKLGRLPCTKCFGRKTNGNIEVAVWMSCSPSRLTEALQEIPWLGLVLSSVSRASWHPWRARALHAFLHLDLSPRGPLSLSQVPGKVEPVHTSACSCSFLPVVRRGGLQGICQPFRGVRHTSPMSRRARARPPSAARTRSVGWRLDGPVRGESGSEGEPAGWSGFAG